MNSADSVKDLPELIRVEWATFKTSLDHGNPSNIRKAKLDFEKTLVEYFRGSKAAELRDVCNITNPESEFLVLRGILDGRISVEMIIDNIFGFDEGANKNIQLTVMQKLKECIDNKSKSALWGEKIAPVVELQKGEHGKQEFLKLCGNIWEATSSSIHGRKSHYAGRFSYAVLNYDVIKQRSQRHVVRLGLKSKAGIKVIRVKRGRIVNSTETAGFNSDVEAQIAEKEARNREIRKKSAAKETSRLMREAKRREELQKVLLQIRHDAKH